MMARTGAWVCTVPSAVWMTDIQRDEVIDFYLKTVKKEKEEEEEARTEISK